MLTKSAAALACTVISIVALTGCRSMGKSLTLPARPALPYLYSLDDYKRDLTDYQAGLQASDAAKAQLARNSIVWGLMGNIDELYNIYSANLFSGKGAIAVTSDTATLGLSSAVAIARKTAAKTLFGALGTAIAGVALSVDKNLFAQQTYQVIALAMETRRTALFNQISDALRQPVADYPLAAAKRDLVLYLYAGSLPGGLQEIQKEAGAASADVESKTPQKAGAPKHDVTSPPTNKRL